MKKLMLLIAMACFFTTGYGQYLPGERTVNADNIPGLLEQLKNNLPGAQKASVLLNIGYGYLYKDGENKQDLDSALQYARQVTRLSTYIKNAPLVQQSLLLTSMINMEQKDFAAAEAVLPAMNDSIRLKSLLHLSLFNSTIATANPEDRKSLDLAAQYCNEALKLAIKTGKLKTNISNALEIVATQYRVRHLVNLAEKYYLLTLTCVDDKGYPSQARVFSNLSILYTMEGNFYKAMDYGIKGEKALNGKSSLDDIVFVYNSLGSLYAVQNRPDKVAQTYAFLLENPHKYKSHIDIYTVLAVYCGSLRKLKRNDEILPFVQKFQQGFPVETDLDRRDYHSILAQSYKEMEQFGPAEKNFLDAIKYAAAAHAPTNGLYYNLGQLYYQFKQYEKAIAILKLAIKELSSENYPVIASNQLYIAKSEAALGNYESAYNYLLSSKTLRDSIFTVDKARLSDELEIQYQTQKKEADLRLKEENIRFLNQSAEIMRQEARLKDARLTETSLLSQKNEIALQLKAKDFEILERNSKLQKAAIEHAAAGRKVTYLIIALMAVIVGLLCWLFWSKLKSNKVVTKKNALLQQLVKDKSWLLKEMHHRVKNNLHTIVSLLESQSTYLQDDALEAIQHSQSRIFSMSLIHQKLYQSDDTKTIDMAAYIPELVDYLKESFSKHRSVRIKMDIQHTAFNVEEAVPLGFIINETVTNSMKYAFKDDQPGDIFISLKATGDDEYELIVADNGIGLSKDFDFNNISSLGFQLIKGLSEQLNATMRITNENGLKITLSGISAYRTHKMKAMENELKEQMAI